MKNKIKELFIAIVTVIGNLLSWLFVVWLLPFVIIGVLPMIIGAVVCSLIMPLLDVVSHSLREKAGSILQSSLVELPKDIINSIMDWF